MTRDELARLLTFAELAGQVMTIWCMDCKAFTHHTTLGTIAPWRDEGVHRCRICGRVQPWRLGVSYGTHEPDA